MNHESGLPQVQSKLQIALGGRFLERTHNELALMQSRLHEARDGDSQAVEQLLQFAHRIGGAAAMLGYTRIGEPVRNVERILRAGILSSAEWSEIESDLEQMQVALNEAGENLIT